MLGAEIAFVYLRSVFDKIGNYFVFWIFVFVFVAVKIKKLI